MTASAPLIHHDSPVHHLDPRLRMLSVLTASIWAAAMPRLEPLAAACVASLLLTVLARIPPAPLLRRLSLFNACMLLVMLTVPFSTVGEPLRQATKDWHRHRGSY